MEHKAGLLNPENYCDTTLKSQQQSLNTQTEKGEQSSPMAKKSIFQ